MTLIALRIFFGGAFLLVCGQAIENARLEPMTGDLRNAYYLVLCAILGLANGAVWAPFFGDLLSQPLTNMLTRDSSTAGGNPTRGLLFRLQERGHRRLTVLCALLEGAIHPGRPAAFLVGMRHARPGTWCQTYFAHQVFRFDNAQHCLEAFKLLRTYGIDPRPHRNPEINNVLMACERQPRPDAPPLPLFTVPGQVPLKRDPRIQLFKASRPGDGTAPTDAAES
ncbi:MAG: hypothetical protein KJ072_02655 [Verrucomicrobia bacterium]|nr:hypothetical protein [Verrucomicrobiota bacterium]